MKDKARADLAVAAWNALKGASWPLFTAIGALTQDEGLTAAQMSLLNVLHDAEREMTPQAVARALAVSPATVTGTLDPLEARGLLARLRGAHEDKRVIVLRLTPAGRALLKRWRESCRALFLEAMGGASDADLRRLIALLEKIAPADPGVPPGLAERDKGVDRPRRPPR